MKVAVVLPAHNEAKRIGPVLEELLSLSFGHDVLPIVVDDGSRDATGDIALDAGATVVRHRTNLGKGAAVKTGCDAACRLGADIVVLMDSDGQHRPADIPAMVAPLLEDFGVPQLVVGTRAFNAEMPIVMKTGNYIFRWLVGMMFAIAVRDTQSGFRAFQASVYPRIRWASSDYAMETEMLILAACHGVRFEEVGIDTIYMDNHKGTTPLDGLRILKTLCKWKFLWSREYSSLEQFSL